MTLRRTVAIPSAFLVAILVMLPAAALAQSSASPHQKITLHVGTINDMVSDNPFAACCPGDWEMNILNYDLMLGFSQKDLSPSPGIATGCDPSSDRMIWTCDIRSGVKWSDGTPLTSKDVAFTYQFILDNNIPNYRDYLPFNPTFETPDDTTLVWHSEKPTFAPIVPPWVYIVPEHIWKQYDGAGLKTIKHVENAPSVGSGPFTLEEWKVGEFWRMDANPYYWGGPSHIDEIIFDVFSSEESMVQALRQGSVDIVDGMSPTLFNSLEGAPNIQTHRTVSDWWLNLAFNFGGQGKDATNLPALHDLALRKAIEQAIDKEAIVKTVYQGDAEPGDTVVRPASTFWHLDIPAADEIQYDPEAAKQTLDQAGYVDTDGDGVREDPATGDPLELHIAAVTTTQGATDAGSLIRGWLDDVGIKVDLSPVSEAKVYDLWAAGDFDAYIWYWSGDPDPDYQMSAFTTGQCLGWSDGCYSDPTFDNMYSEQRDILDPAKRLELIDKMQQYLYDQIPCIVLAYPSGLQAYRTDHFTGWEPAPGPDGYLVGGGYGTWSYRNITPVTGEATAEPGLSGVVWLVVGAGVVLVVGAFLFARRSRREDEA